jgi:DNA-binding NtrC family response regulator
MSPRSCPIATFSRKWLMSPRILVVSGDGERLNVLVDSLNGAGYLASGASTFAEGKQLVESKLPDLVIADERLGPFNGLHLIVVSRARHPRMKAIVTSHVRDAALENDAKRLHVQCLVEPTEISGWLASISSTLDRELEVVH